MTPQHVEFPELMPEVKKALDAAYKAAFPWHAGYKEKWTESNRKGQAAFLREATKQARRACLNGQCANIHDELEAIAANLHSPPPPPPTLAQAREADLLTPEGRDVVCAFLATLGEVQP